MCFRERRPSKIWKPLTGITLKWLFLNSEAVARRCSVKKVFLEISQNSQGHKVAGLRPLKKEILAQVFSCEFYEIIKHTFSYRTPPVVAFLKFTERYL